MRTRPVQLNLEQALELKESGLALVEAASDPSWLARARVAALGLWNQAGRRHEPVDSDLVKAVVGEPEHENLAGAIFRVKGWHQAGWRRSSRPSGHARIIMTWRWEEA